MTERLILEFPNAVPADGVEFLRECMRENMDLNSGGYDNREGKTIFITLNAGKSESLRKADEYLAKVFDELSSKVDDIYHPLRQPGDSGYEYHLYEPGDVCRQHADGEFVLSGSVNDDSVFRTNSLIRYATAVLYLTTHDDGELVFPECGVSVKPEAGKAVVFPPTGAYRHYSNAAAADREIVMTWFVYSDVNAVLLQR